jgi:hypothetical protein
MRHDHEGAFHERVASPAQFKALNCEVACRVGIEPNRIGASVDRIRLDSITNYSEIVKDVGTSYVKANVLPDWDTKNVTRLIRLSSVVIGELPVELMCSDLDCATLADMLRRREDVVDSTKASDYQRHYDYG